MTDLEDRLNGRISPLKAAMVGAIISSLFAITNIKNKNEMAVYDKVNKAGIIETHNPKEARPWDYCRNENSKNIRRGDTFYDACLQRMYSENPGLKEGRYLQTLKVRDIDGNGKVSSKH